MVIDSNQVILKLSFYEVQIAHFDTFSFQNYEHKFKALKQKRINEEFTDTNKCEPSATTKDSIVIRNSHHNYKTDATQAEQLVHRPVDISSSTFIRVCAGYASL